MKVKTFILKSYDKENKVVILKENFVTLELRLKTKKINMANKEKVLKFLEKRLEEYFKQIGINRKVIIKDLKED